MELTIGKIVGIAGKKSWSQVHAFRPENEKLSSHGELLATLNFKVKQEEIDPAAFGNEIILRLQEIYYSNESDSVLKKIEQAMESLEAEFMVQVDLKMVVGVSLKKGARQYLYVGRRGGGQAYLKRGDQVVKLLAEDDTVNQVVSGEIKTGDKMLLGTDRFFAIVAEGVVGPSLGEAESGAVEKLAGIVHGQDKNARAAALVVECGEAMVEAMVATAPIISENKQFSESIEGDKNDFKSISPLSKLKDMWHELRRKVEKVWQKYAWRMPIRLKSGKKEKSAATVALVLVLVFGLSVVMAGAKKQKEKKQAEYLSVVEEVKYRVGEAKGLIDLNPLRAKSLLGESKMTLDEYKQKIGGELTGELADLEKEIASLTDNVQKEYAVEDAKEWFDFNLTSEGFKGDDWGMEEEIVWVYDRNKNETVELNLKSKASKVVANSSQVKSGEQVGITGKRGFVVDNKAKRITVLEEKEQIEELNGQEWGVIKESVAFGSNLYLLDSVANGQIWKYVGIDAGLSAKSGYLKAEGLDLSSAVSMAIDGSVWVLFSDGSIAKYVRGVKDAFVVAGLDEAMVEPVKIFTSPEVENIYVADRKKTRIVVIGKNGEYQSQYVWGGVAGLKDLAVSEAEGKIFVLTGEKVFAIDLKK